LVLVVEDDPALAESLQLFLAADGHQSAMAANGPDAIECVERKAVRPDLVIADYNLPGGLTGPQVVARLRETLGRDVPALVLTGDISTETLRDIAAQGYEQRSKPVAAQDLTDLVHRLLSAPVSAMAKARQEPVIFVVDDDGALRQAMGDLLRESGRSVETYPSAEAFLRAYRPGQEGCLLLVDAAMPGMGGFGLLERLKDVDDRLPAIMITGVGDVRTAVRAMRAGAMDFIEKPISEATLNASIAKALERSRDSARAPQQGHRHRPRHQSAYGGNASRRDHAQDRRQIAAGAGQVDVHGVLEGRRPAASGSRNRSTVGVETFAPVGGGMALAARRHDLSVLSTALCASC
jgi:two-component system CheB/CheR fusion protein